VYLRDPTGPLTLHSRPAPHRPPALPDDDAALMEVERAGKPWEPPGVAEDRCSPLLSLQADCLVPVLSRRRTLSGIIALGPRLSDDPYSREDKALLASIASQAGVALESLVLAEQMAERLEAERRTSQELRIADDVQRRLLPATAVSLSTLECAGHCTQARAVGGDYYDFLDLGDGQLGLVLADVSGKGLYAALLMASLRASLRSLSAGWGSRELPLLMQRLNRSFGESTGGSHYATVFLGLYDDRSRQWSYVDCGHCPPVVLRADGSVIRLAVTGVAVGLFEQWTGTSEQIALGPGDVLAVFSDGVTEAIDAGDEEFGEGRLVEALRTHRGRPLPEVVDAVIGQVRQFDGREQYDDMTLVLARGR
jgi:sigma-B regulation protein RsbU (phosphoserine phosphatase)